MPSNCDQFGRGHVRYYSRISLALSKCEDLVVAYANQTKSIRFIEFRSRDINHLIKNLSHIICNFKDTMQFHVFTKSSSHPLGSVVHTANTPRSDQFVNWSPTLGLKQQKIIEPTRSHQKTACGRLVGELLIYKRFQLQSY